MASRRAGDRDPEFNPTGTLIYKPYGATWDATASPPMIWLAGYARNLCYIERRAGDGTTMFAAQHHVFPGGVQSWGLKVFLLGDQVLLFGAAFDRDTANFRPALARYSHAMTLDTSFGDPLTPGNSVVPTPGVEDPSTLVARVTAEHIYILAPGGGSRPNRLTRLMLGTGLLDLSFNGTGTLEISGVPGSDVRLKSFETAESDSRIILVGDAIKPQQDVEVGVYVGVTRAGVLDSTFGEDGFIWPNLHEFGVRVFGSMRKQQLVEAVVGLGAASDYWLFDGSPMVMSLNRDGSPDFDFNDGKPLWFPFERHTLVWTRGVQGEGSSLIAAGYRIDSNVELTLPAFGRIDANFEWDPNFGEEGKVVIGDFGRSKDEIHDMFVQGDGLVVIFNRGDNSGELRRYFL